MPKITVPHVPQIANFSEFDSSVNGGKRYPKAVAKPQMVQLRNRETGKVTSHHIVNSREILGAANTVYEAVNDDAPNHSPEAA